jgi:hypothetical protein
LLERLENFTLENLYESEDGLPSRVHFDRHLYLPLLVSDPKDPPMVRYSPPGLNKGERNFVRKLKDFVSSEDGKRILEEHDSELFLLRNRSRGHGVGFLPDDDGFYPDFILWLKNPTKQRIAFIEPHGLKVEGDPEKNPKVEFSKTIKEHEKKLNTQSGRDDIELFSFIISQTEYKNLPKQTKLKSIDEFNAMNLYFAHDNSNYVRCIFQKILPSEEDM